MLGGSHMMYVRGSYHVCLGGHIMYVRGESYHAY